MTTGKAPISRSRTTIVRTLRQAQHEYADVGLLTRPLARIPINTPATDLAIDMAYGCYFYGNSWSMPLLGFKKGEIVIPRFSMQGALDQLAGQREWLIDVIRHEMGHALAYTVPDAMIIDDPAFAFAFGAKHEAKRSRGARANFVSRYARTNPAEDFAECVRVFVKHEGDLRRFKGKLVEGKMRYVARLPSRLKKRGMQVRVTR